MKNILIKHLKDNRTNSLILERTRTLNKQEESEKKFIWDSFIKRKCLIFSFVISMIIVLFLII